MLQVSVQLIMKTYSFIGFIELIVLIEFFVMSFDGIRDCIYIETLFAIFMFVLVSSLKFSRRFK